MRFYFLVGDGRENKDIDRIWVLKSASRPTNEDCICSEGKETWSPNNDNNEFWMQKQTNAILAQGPLDLELSFWLGFPGTNIWVGVSRLYIYE